MKYAAHDAANEFPTMPDERLKTLAEDIKNNGQRESIKLFDGKILDGRNRYAACNIAGVEPRFEILSDINPWEYVWSLNGERRDLTADQRYLIWKDCNEHSEQWQAEKQRIVDEANLKRSEAAKEQENRGNQYTKKVEVAPQVVGSPAKNHSKIVSQAKAKSSKTNRGTVERMDALAKKRPELAEKVKMGEMPAATAIREMKREEIINKLDDISSKELKKLQGVYDVIVIDPPRQMKKINRDERPNQVEFDYPVMSEEELGQFKIPASDDCHIFLWTTHKFLPMSLRLLDVWKLKYVLCMTWHKSGGFQPIGLPQYNSEFVIYARRGKPVFIDTKNFNTCFSANRGGHSEKPEEFYETLRRVTAGRRVDIFNRREISGFDSWGYEANGV